MSDGGDSSRARTLLAWLIGVNAALLVASNAAGAKIIALPGGLTASATVFSYALTFTFTDTIAEIFGKKAADNAVRVAFAGLVLSVLFFRIAISAPPASEWSGQAAYDETLGLGGRLLLGGWLSYMVSQHLDVFLFHRIGNLTSRRLLWLRNNLSTMISQFVDSTIFITIAFYGLIPLWPTILGQYLVKVIIALVDTPVVYGAVALARRYIRREVPA